MLEIVGAFVEEIATVVVYIKLGLVRQRMILQNLSLFRKGTKSRVVGSNDRRALGSETGES